MAKVQVFIDTQTGKSICELTEVSSERQLARTPDKTLRDCLNEARRGLRGNEARVKYVKLLRFVEKHGIDRIAVGFIDRVTG